jgi:hypothetical protein
MLHNIFSTGIIPLIISIALFFCLGFLPSLIRHYPIQRTWLITVAPFSVTVFMLISDGMFLQEPAIDVTKTAIMISGVIMIAWVVTNVVEKGFGLIVKKGDLEVSLKKEGAMKKYHVDAPPPATSDVNSP